MYIDSPGGVSDGVSGSWMPPDLFVLLLQWMINWDDWAEEFS